MCVVVGGGEMVKWMVAVRVGCRSAFEICLLPTYWKINADAGQKALLSKYHQIVFGLAECICNYVFHL